MQKLVHESPGVIVTYLERARLSRTITIGGAPALENDSPVVWFTFPDAHHDIGRFHLADGQYTGLYANILEPVEMVSRNEWRATDLFLDVWVGLSGQAELLDESELDDAVTRGWVQENTAHAARAEAQRLMAGILSGAWPPAVVHAWTLERVRGTLKHNAG